VLGAAVGAPLPYLTDRAVQRRHDTLFPWGTFTVNVIGSFILGAVVGAARAGAASRRSSSGSASGSAEHSPPIRPLSYETLRLTEDGARFFAAANVVATIVAGLGAAVVGASISQALWS
jgi:fluoride exporter